MKETLEELASLYVLDQLGHDERTAFETRLLREPELAPFVRTLEIGLARGVRALPPHEPPAGLLARIEEQIDAPQATSPVVIPSPSTFRWSLFARWGLAALIAISLVTIAVQSLRRIDARPVIVFVGLDADRNTFADLPEQELAKDPDSRFIQLASLAQSYWVKPGNLPVKLDSAAGANRGYALFDPGSRQGFIAIEQLPVVAENQRYHLWSIDPATALVHDAGILPMVGMNRGLYSFTLAPVEEPKSARPNFFITVEENSAAPQPAQPRGKVVLGKQRF